MRSNAAPPGSVASGPAAADGADRLPPGLLNTPWIDAHNHAHTLSWSDRERYALDGCLGMVTVAGGYHWTPYTPVEMDDVQYLWDDALARRAAIQRAHGFEMGLAVGVHTAVRVADAGAIAEVMAPYCASEAVVAVGETGVTPAQYEGRWELPDQRAAVRDQLALADEHDLPVLLHTPSGDAQAGAGLNRGAPAAYEQDASLRSDPVIDTDEPARTAAEIDVAVADEVGLPHDRIVASHAGPATIEYLMEETGCYASITVGYPWLTGVTAADAAAAIDRYGPDRLMLDTDAANVLRSDVHAVKRAMFELARLGVDVDAIRQVAYENPASVFGVGGEA